MPSVLIIGASRGIGLGFAQAYAAADGGASNERQAWTVPDRAVFVLGDNRNRSIDSRRFGFVPAGDILGYVQYIYWPAASWSRFGTLRP